MKIILCYNILYLNPVAGRALRYGLKSKANGAVSHGKKDDDLFNVIDELVLFNEEDDVDDKSGILLQILIVLLMFF